MSGTVGLANRTDERDALVATVDKLTARLRAAVRELTGLDRVEIQVNGRGVAELVAEMTDVAALATSLHVMPS